MKYINELKETADLSLKEGGNLAHLRIGAESLFPRYEGRGAQLSTLTLVDISTNFSNTLQRSQTQGSSPSGSGGVRSKLHFQSKQKSILNSECFEEAIRVISDIGTATTKTPSNTSMNNSINSVNQTSNYLLVENPTTAILNALGLSTHIDPQCLSEYALGSLFLDFPTIQPHEKQRQAFWRTSSLRKRHITVQWPRLYHLKADGLRLEQKRRCSDGTRRTLRKAPGVVGVYRECEPFTVESMRMMEYVNRVGRKGKEKAGAEGLGPLVVWQEKATLYWTTRIEDGKHVASIQLFYSATPFPIPIDRTTVVQIQAQVLSRYGQAKLFNSQRSNQPASVEVGIQYFRLISKVFKSSRGSSRTVPRNDPKERLGLQLTCEIAIDTTKAPQTFSTGNTICRWLEEYCNSTRQTSGPDAFPPSSAPSEISFSDIILIMLFTVVLRDSLQVRTVIAEELRHIFNQIQMADLETVEVLPWQRQLAIYREQLHIISQAVSVCCDGLREVAQKWAVYERSFPNVSIGPSAGDIGDLPSNTSPLILDLYRDLLALDKQLEAQKALVQETSGTLMSAISIVESQSAIAEAKSVTKLTEMAFLFIPLGFSASIFGMEVKEFENKVSLATWGITVACILAGAYSVRIIARSQLLQGMKRSAGDGIRSQYGGGKTTSLRSRDILRYSFHRTKLLFQDLLDSLLISLYGGIAFTGVYLRFVLLLHRKVEETLRIRILYGTILISNFAPAFPLFSSLAAFANTYVLRVYLTVLKFIEKVIEYFWWNSRRRRGDDDDGDDVENQR